MVEGTCQKDTEISLRGSHRLTLKQYSKTNSYYNKATEKGMGQGAQEEFLCPIGRSRDTARSQ